MKLYFDPSPTGSDGAVSENVSAVADAQLTPASSALPLAAGSSSPTVAVAAEARAGRAWVPIRSLGPRHRPRIAAHLIALDERSRYLRFGYASSDSQIKRYVDTLDFDKDEVFGIFNRRLELIALAHLAHRDADPVRDREAASEFGVSVLPKARRRGFGRRLFEHAMLHARNRGVETLMIHALSENTAMLKIARNAGATVVREGTESDAWLKLPPDTLGSHVGEMVEEQAAELDYRLKLHALQVTGLLDTLGEVKSSMSSKAAHVAEE